MSEVPYSFDTEMAGMVDLFIWVDQATGHLFAPLITVGLFAMAYLYIPGNKVEVSAAASVLTALTSYFLFIMGILQTPEVMYLWTLMAAGTGFALFGRANR